LAERRPAALLDRGWTVVGDARRAHELESAARELNSARLIARPPEMSPTRRIAGR